MRTNYEPPNPYDLYDGEEDFPFRDDHVWEDEDRAYDEARDEEWLEYIKEQRHEERTD